MPSDLFALLGQPLHGEVQGLNSESEGFQFLNCLGSRAGIIDSKSKLYQLGEFINLRWWLVLFCASAVRMFSSAAKAFLESGSLSNRRRVR